MADPWAEPVGSQGGWGTSAGAPATTPRRTSLAASVQNLAVDSENVPLSALAGRTGRTPNKRMTMGGPTMLPYRGSPQGSPLANRSNYGAPTSPPSAPPSALYPNQPTTGVRTRSMGPPPPPAAAGGRGEVTDGSGDPWGAGTNWTTDSPAAKAQAQRRRQTSYVPGTGSMAPRDAHFTRDDAQMPPPGRPSHGGVKQEDEFHSVPSSPWGSPAKTANGGGFYGRGVGGMGSPPSAPPPPAGAAQGAYASHARAQPQHPGPYGESQSHQTSPRGWSGAGAVVGYGTPARLEHGASPSRLEHSVSAPVTRRGSPEKPRRESPSGAYLRGLQREDDGSTRRERDEYPSKRDEHPRAQQHHPHQQQHHPHQDQHQHQHQQRPNVAPQRSAHVLPHAHQSQSLYAGRDGHATHAVNPVALAGAAPEGCYLGQWRGDERARILAYEACLQACLEGSLGSNAPQHKVDMAVHFLADRCAELRRGFGMDGILVGSRGNANTLLGNGTNNADEIKSPSKSDRRESKFGAFDTGGGQRWSGVTVDVTEVSIVTRGWKRFTGGVDPRDVYQAAREGGARAAAAAATAAPHSRGDICRVRACPPDDGFGGGGDSATLHVGCGDARVRLAAADEALLFEVDLGGGKIASCKPTLEELSKMSGEGRNIVELPLRYASGKEKGYVRFTAHLEPIGGYDWGAPLTNLDFHNSPGAGGASDPNGWAQSSNGPLPPSAAYDVALTAALRALGFHRRRLALHGPWAWLLRELSELQGVSPNHTSLRYVRHVLAVATPTADCLASILDHLAPCLRESAEGRLTATEADQLTGIRGAVEQLVGVCFQNYKNLSEDEPRGIAKQVPEQQPAPALPIALELSRILQRDPLAPEALRALQNHLQTAARSCYRRHHAVFLGDRTKNGSGEGPGAGDFYDEGHAKLFAGLSQLCLGLCRELGVDHTIQDANVLPPGIRLPQLAAGVYCHEASGCVAKMLTQHPPPAPPGAEAIDLVDALCELQEAAVAADVSDQYDANPGVRQPPSHHPPYPGVGGAPAASALDPKALFAPHVASWIEAARETLLHGCVSALGKHGVGGAAMDEAYREAHTALEGFERVVARWPDAAAALEKVLADADRLLLQRIGAAAEEGGRGVNAGGLFRGYANVNAGASMDPGARPHGVRESVRFTGHNLQRVPAFHRANLAHHPTIAEEPETSARGGNNPLASPNGKHGGNNTVHGALHRLRAGKAAAAAALRQARAAAEKARSKFDAGATSRVVSATAEEGYVPPELAAALTALKAMEVLRPEVGQRLVLWVSAAGGGQRAAGEAFGRVSAEVLGELRAQYAAHLRRAVAGVAASGPSLLCALRAAALNPPPGFENRGEYRERDESYGEEGDEGSADGDGSAEAASRDELEAVVAPILAHVDVVVSGLRRAIPQRRALVGVLRGLWDHLGGEALKFVEEDLRQRSSWRLRLIATGASERVSAAVSGAIRDALGHDVKEKDLEPPAPVKKLADFIGGTAAESISVY